MKKIAGTVFTIVLAMCILFATAANADVIWEPEGNSFFDNNRDDCVYDGSVYIVNGKEGNVTAYDKPNGKAKFGIENGERISVLFTYVADGETWGITEYAESCDDPDSTNVRYESVWLKADELVKVYTGDDFYEDHWDEIVKAEGEYNSITPEAGREVYFWTYPCSGEVAMHIASDPGEEIYYNDIWTDGDGRQWGFVAYHYGTRGVWICISDLYDGSIPDTLKHDYGDIFIDAVPTEELPAGPMTAVILAVAAVAAAAVCIAVLWKRKKSDSEA